MARRNDVLAWFVVSAVYIKLASSAKRVLVGVVSMCQGLTQTAGGLYACRFIMGALEGSLAPGMI
jgi:hypothetical protein